MPKYCSTSVGLHCMKLIWNLTLHFSIISVIYLFAYRWAGERLLNIDSGRYVDYRAPPNEHFTVIFNAFVMMTFFNEIGSRKIHGEHNVFAGMHRNPLFIAILLITFIAQVRFRVTCRSFHFTSEKKVMFSPVCSSVSLLTAIFKNYWSNLYEILWNCLT